MPAQAKEFVFMPAPITICRRSRDPDFSSTQNECPGFVTCRWAIHLDLVNLERGTRLVSRVRELFYASELTG